MSARYAVYYAPVPEHPLARFAAAWLQHDPAGGPCPPRPGHPSLKGVDLEAITAEPRRYGFHGTLKPPFHLAAGCTEPDLFAAVDALARRLSPLTLPALRPTLLGGFVALTPTEACRALDALAAACVRDLDPLRAPPSADERARRLAGRPLSAMELALLERWGYPYVMDAFRFHLTLTGNLTVTERASVSSAMDSLIERDWVTGLAVDALTVFRQASPGARFQIVHRAPLEKQRLA